jgi:hypothetical protein
MNTSDSIPGFEQAMALGKMVPGFDFLQGLATSAVKGASQAVPQMPHLGSWIAPTLNVEELDKRITELRAVQFWLDQNATALKATIQALEVQKMTISTLQGMNVQMGDLAQAFKLKMPQVPQASDASEAPDEPKEHTATAGPAAASSGKSPASKGKRAQPRAGTSGASANTVVDPMQWWGALTQQFQQIASSALRDAAQKAASNKVRGVAREAASSAAGAAQAVGSVVRGKEPKAAQGVGSAKPAAASKSRARR